MLLHLSPAIAQDQRSGNGDAASASLLVHLGMTGMLALFAAEQPCEKHTHVVMRLDDGRELRYTDPRRFGRMAYLPEASLATELSPFGADPLEVTAEEFDQRIRSRHARVKALFLDQGVLRGVGNIYADESLWRAKIHPARLGTDLSKAQVRKLRKALQHVLQKAILSGGSSISDFLDAEGQPGEYQRHHRAYGREGKPCYRCGTAIRRAIVAGRSSFFCRRCQPPPRSTRRRLGRTKKRHGRNA
jgi:formamidopyrimidine-DNA glycosylase